MNIRIKTKYIDEQVSLECAVYALDKSLNAVCIDAVDPNTGEPVLTITTYLPECSTSYTKDQIMVKDYTENEGVAQALVDAKMGKIMGPTGGFVPFKVTAPGLLILMEAAREQVRMELAKQ